MVACSHDTGHFTLRLGHLIDLLFTPRLDINEMCSETVLHLRRGCKNIIAYVSTCHGITRTSIYANLKLMG